MLTPPQRTSLWKLYLDKYRDPIIQIILVEAFVSLILSRNVISAGIRNLPGFSMGTVSGDCWQKTARMQVSYDNILEWLYGLCETIGGSTNVRLDGNALKCDLFSGTDRSLLQDDNPHIIYRNPEASGRNLLVRDSSR